MQLRLVYKIHHECNILRRVEEFGGLLEVRRRRILAAFTSLLLAAGCSGGSGPDPVLVEGEFPVPGSAIMLGSNTAAYNEMMGETSPHIIGNQLYDTQMSPSKAFSLYASWLPEGENYRDWEWCEERKNGRESYQTRTIEYLDRKKNHAFVITISWDRESRVANPPDTTVTVYHFDLDLASPEFRASKLECGG